MTFVISPGCCNDASCIDVCPVQCIRPRPGDPDFLSTEQLYIDPATCIDCHACVDACPIDAAHADYDMPEGSVDLLRLNAEYFERHPIIDDTPLEGRRTRLPQERPALRVAVVGSGPAACYAVEALADVRGAQVTVLERLPTPFGLVRGGVAPDHDRTKKIADAFGTVLARRNVTTLLNVEVGRDVTVEELLEHHHAVIWAGGASGDRKLGIPGEHLHGSHSAREFVGWYNGDPAHSASGFDLGEQTVVLVGNGNVALDVARSLTRPVSDLEATDMADHALAALRDSQVRDVVIVARRGPEHAAYSTGELQALDNLDGVDLLAHADEVTHAQDPEDPRHAILAAAARRVPNEGNKRITLRFQLTPSAIEGETSVRGITFGRPNGEAETIKAGLVLRAIGYRGTPPPGLPFDEAASTVPHHAGRVVTADEQAIPGLYCTGWIKRGATGVIGTNKFDARETVDSILEDFLAGALADPAPDPGAFIDGLRARHDGLLDYAGWKRIDAAERAAGRAAGRVRSKLVTVAELLDASREALG